MGEKIGGYKGKLSPHTKREVMKAQAHLQQASRLEDVPAQEARSLIDFLLSSLDIREMKNVFLDYLKKSQVPLEYANVEVFERIDSANISAGGPAMFATLQNRIVFFLKDGEVSQMLVELRSGKTPTPAALMKMQLVLFHELCHAMSRVRVNSIDTEDSLVQNKLESGYTISNHLSKVAPSGDEVEFISNKVIFEAFNEGVTQRIAEELFIEYSKRVGSSREMGQYLSQFIGESTQRPWRTYRYAQQVDTMCERIAAYVGVSKDLVWGSIKRGYFEQPELYHEETIELFKETFGEAFLAEHGKMGNHTSDRTLEAFDVKYDIGHVSGYAQKWLNHLKIPSPVTS